MIVRHMVDCILHGRDLTLVVDQLDLDHTPHGKGAFVAAHKVRKNLCLEGFKQNKQAPRL